ncbi:hypothetical protein COCSADRAFT_40524 [Bipolaris sorokiniana ND90Pr]|uniref:Uncharacterized protein n=1 Tax=Cochliobolus sativus (strain ND90Pr / ATCC 201652) TaxID=665912 RepID=M2QYK9_COCSN|nr:uncharacterized protein COCSADRAFT_40524 [Bipolaris sorokiniana ND90Pr]EMD60094.1 hypothetical protein COCSADRAFT_40524 [Bipolaris sorokiniana ND90Pr]
MRCWGLYVIVISIFCGFCLFPLSHSDFGYASGKHSIQPSSHPFSYIAKLTYAPYYTLPL